MIFAIATLGVGLVASIGIAVAAFTTDLQINGEATVRSTVWDIHFANPQPVSLTDATKENTAPTIQTSTNSTPLAAIKDYNVELKELYTSTTERYFYGRSVRCMLR